MPKRINEIYLVVTSEGTRLWVLATSAQMAIDKTLRDYALNRTEGITKVELAGTIDVF